MRGQSIGRDTGASFHGHLMKGRTCSKRTTTAGQSVAWRCHAVAVVVEVVVAVTTIIVTGFVVETLVVVDQ